MKHIFTLISILLFSSPLFACPDESVKDVVYKNIESDEGVGIIRYGAFFKDQKVTIEDMERENIYSVKSEMATVVSAHGSYHSGYFIIVLEIHPQTCELLEKDYFYEE